MFSLKHLPGTIAGTYSVTCLLYWVWTDLFQACIHSPSLSKDFCRSLMGSNPPCFFCWITSFRKVSFWACRYFLLQSTSNDIVFNQLFTNDCMKDLDWRIRNFLGISSKEDCVSRYWIEGSYFTWDSTFRTKLKKSKVYKFIYFIEGRLNFIITFRWLIFCNSQSNSQDEHILISFI